MTQDAETVAMDLNIVSCQTCDALFIESERRQTCPSCGGLPVGPYFQFVLDGSGLHQKDGAAPAAAGSPLAEEPAPEPEAPAAEAPVEEEEPIMIGPVADKVPVAGAMLAGFLTGEVEEVEYVREWLVELGAEPEAVAAAVGRLVAVRDLLRELVAAGVEAQVEVAVEETPAPAPPPAPPPAEGEPPAAPEPEPAGGGEESQPPEAV